MNDDFVTSPPCRSVCNYIKSRVLCNICLFCFCLLDWMIRGGKLHRPKFVSPSDRFKWWDVIPKKMPSIHPYLNTNWKGLKMQQTYEHMIGIWYFLIFNILCIRYRRCRSASDFFSGPDCPRGLRWRHPYGSPVDGTPLISLGCLLRYLNII